MLEAKIAVHRVNEGLVGLIELSGVAPGAVVLDVPGGGRVLIDSADILERITRLLGPASQSTNPFEQRRRKEFLRRARRTATNAFAAHADCPA